VYKSSYLLTYLLLHDFQHSVVAASPEECSQDRSTNLQIRRWSHAWPLLCQLHWLPVCNRIDC